MLVTQLHVNFFISFGINWGEFRLHDCFISKKNTLNAKKDEKQVNNYLNEIDRRKRTEKKMENCLSMRVTFE